MDTLDRFLIREFAAYFFIVLFALSALFIGVDFFSKVWSLDISASRIFELYAYKLPATVQQFIPVACLMTTLFVLSNMSKQNEILLLYTSGTSPIRILSTFVMIVAIISTASFLAFDPLVPAFAKKSMLLQKGLSPSQEQALFFGQSRLWYRSGRLVYNVGRFIPESSTLEDVNLYILGSSFRLSEKIHAKTARFVDNDWVLEEGSVTRYPSEAPYPISEPFKQLTGIIPEKPSDFKTLKVAEETMRLRDLRKFISRNKSYGLDTTASSVNYHERMALVFAPLIFCLFAFPFATKPLRTSSIPKSIALCFGSVFIYLLMFRFTLSLGRGGHIPPLVAGWVPNAVFLVYSTVLLSKVMPKRS
ncbi:MAG: LptF/LptG family permease [Deltaproteobacteria bacterium]|nr:LptF/LptG family permease [Deltaproteobacteria bacterium]